MTDYFERIHAGLPIDDVEIIDMHAHLGPYYNMHIPRSDSGSMIRMMDQLGIDKTVVSATPGICSDMVLGNDMTLEAIRAHRGRIYGACYVNGNYPELSLDELERCFGEEPDMVFVKTHPLLNKCKLDDRRMKPLYEWTSDRKLILLVHTWLDQDAYGSQDQFAKVAKDYPDIMWIMGHTGGPFGGTHGFELAEEIPNFFLDITLSTCPARQIETFVKEAGADRVLFGTDNPFIDPKPQVGRVMLADISQEDRVKILSGNARRFVDFG